MYHGDVFSRWVDLAYDSISPLGLNLWSPIEFIQSPIKFIQKSHDGIQVNNT